MPEITRQIGKVSIVTKGQYNSNTTYERLDLVSWAGSCYMAKQNVPAGTALTNTDYWMQVGFGDGLDFVFYSSVSELSLTVGSATLADALANMRNKSILLTVATDFISNEWPVTGNSTTYGIIEIKKYEAARASIIYYGKGGSTFTDYRMYLDTNGVPAQPWYKIFDSSQVIPIANGGTGTTSINGIIDALGLTSIKNNSNNLMNQKIQTYTSVTQLGLNSTNYNNLVTIFNAMPDNVPSIFIGASGTDNYKEISKSILSDSTVAKDNRSDVAASRKIPRFNGIILIFRFSNSRSLVINTEGVITGTSKIKNYLAFSHFYSSADNSTVDSLAPWVVFG